MGFVDEYRKKKTHSLLTSLNGAEIAPVEIASKTAVTESKTEKEETEEDLAPIASKTAAEKFDDFVTQTRAAYGNTVLNNKSLLPTSGGSGGLDFFKPVEIDNGWDVLKAAGATVGDAAVGVTKGAASMVEGITDLILYGTAGLSSLSPNLRTLPSRTLTPSDDVEVAPLIKEIAQKNTVSELFAPVDEVLDEYSVLGETSDAIMQGLGQVGAMIATGGLAGAAGLGSGAVSALTMGMQGLSSAGSGMSEAYAAGATDGEAAAYGAMKGIIDAGSEMLFGGLGKAVKAVGLSRGLSSLDDVFAKKLSSKISNQVLSNLVEFGVKASAEGVEEVLAGVGTAVAKKLTYMSDEELSSLIKDENLLESFVVGTVASGIAQSGIVPGTKKGSLIESTKSGKDLITDLTKDEQIVLDKVFEERVSSAEDEGGALTLKEKDNIYDEVLRDLERGYISTDEIESILGGETYKALRDTVDSENEVQREYESLADIKKSDLTTRQETRLQELKDKLEKIKQEGRGDALKTKLREEVQARIGDSKLAESYRERTRRSEAYAADLSQYDAKQQAVIQNAIDSGILNNTNRTHEFVDMVAKISADKGVSFQFTNNAKLKESGFAMDGVTVNGMTTGDGVTVNIDSAKALDSVVGHEISHILEGTDLYAELQNSIFEYAKTKGEYDSRRAALAKIYGGTSGANIDAELTADLVGDYLFTDSEFINHLSTKNRSLFQKIFDEIKYLLKVVSAGSKEARELERVKRAFDKAYRAQKNTDTIESTKYSLAETTDGRFVAVVDNDILSHIDTSSWNREKKDLAKKAATESLKQFSGGIVVDGVTKKVNKISRDEFTRSRYTENLYRKNPDIFADKMRSADIADDVLIATTNWNRDGKLSHLRNDSFVDFEHGKTLILSGDAKYSAEVVVGIRKDGSTVFYDMVDITPTEFDIKKEETSTAATTQNAIGAIQEVSTDSSISQKRSDVNTLGDKNFETKKENLPTPTGEQAPINTPETNSGTVFSDKSISQNSEKSSGFEKIKKGVPSSAEMMQRSLSAQGERGVSGGGNFYGEDVWLDVAPVRQNAQRKTDVPDIAGGDIAPVGENENKSRVNDWLKVNRLQLPLPNAQSYSATDSITEKEQNVNSDLKKSSDNRFAPLPEEGDLRREHVGTGLLDDPLNETNVGDGAEDIAPVRNIEAKGGAEQDVRPTDDTNDTAGAASEQASEGKKTSRGKKTERRWVGTSTESEAVRGTITREDIPDDVRHYRVKANKETLASANERLARDGFAKSMEHFKNRMLDRKLSVEDIALGERLIQEAAKANDADAVRDLIIDVSILGTELGQRVQALSIINRLTPEGQLKVLTRTVQRGRAKGDRAWDGVEITKDMSGRITGVYKEDGTFDSAELTSAVEDVKQQIAEQMSVGAMDSVNAWRYLSMLGNPKTHIRNVVSNVAMMGTRAVKNAIARTVEGIFLPKPEIQTDIAPIDVKIPNGTKVRAADRGNVGTVLSYNAANGEYTVRFKNKAGKVKDVQFDEKSLTPIAKSTAGARQRPTDDTNVGTGVVEDIAPVHVRTKTWRPVSGDVKFFAKVTTEEMEAAIKGEAKYSDEGSIKAKRKFFKSNALNVIAKANTAAMEFEDAIFAKYAFRRTFGEYLTANGIRTDEDIRNNPRIVENAKEYALEESRLATFRQDSYFADKISEIERKNPLFGIVTGSVLPFKRTPINIAKTGLAYSPLGFARNIYDAVQVKKGNMDASAAVDHLAQTLTGTSLALIGFALADAGILLGAGDDDKEGKYDYQLGDQAYSFRFGGDSYSLSWLTPVAMPLFVGANAYEMLVEKNEWDANVVIDTLAQTLDPLSEMSFLSSLDDVLSSYDDGIQKIWGAGSSMLQNYATQFIPTLSSQIAAITDDTKRSTAPSADSGFDFGEETIRKMMYKVPGLRNLLEPTTDIWGNEVSGGDNFIGRAFESLLSPANRRQGIRTAVDEELENLYGETGDASILPAIPDNSVSYDGAKHEMSAGEYTAYKQAYGQMAHDLLAQLFDTETYRAATSEERADMVGMVYDYARDAARKEYFAGLGIDYTNAESDGEEIYKESPIKGAIEADMTTDEYVFSKDYPAKYAVAKSVGGYESWKTYTSELYAIKADKDESGKTISGSRKEKVIAYLNDLDADYGEKIILFKSEYNADDTYNADIVEYLNSREDISYEDAVTILTELGMTVHFDGTVTWD